MRILVLTNLYPNPFQPHRATFNRQQLRLLAARHCVRVIAPILWGDELAARRAGQPPLPPGRRVEHDGIVVDHPRYVYPPGLLRGWYGHFFRRCVHQSFERALAEFGPDLVYATWAYPDGWAAVELGRRAGLPVAVKVHGSDILTLDRYPRRRRRTVDALRRADAVIAVSQDLANRVVALGAEAGRVHVVYNGVDTARFCPGPRGPARVRLGLDPDAGVIVLAVANLEPIKGVDVLIEACALLRAALPRFRCVVIGQGTQRSVLERLIDRLALREHVRLLGPLPHEDLPDWYRAADVVALPSRSEGIPNVLLEAMACGAPFVASGVGGVAEVAHRGPGRLVPPGDPGRLAEALREQIAAPRDSSRRPPTGRSHEDAVDEMAEVFDRILARHPVPPREREASPGGLRRVAGQLAPLPATRRDSKGARR